jgi:hypothetical protein
LNPIQLWPSRTACSWSAPRTAQSAPQSFAPFAPPAPFRAGGIGPRRGSTEARRSGAMSFPSSPRTRDHRLQLVQSFRCRLTADKSCRMPDLAGDWIESVVDVVRRASHMRLVADPLEARPRAAACTRSPRRGPSPKGVVELEPKGDVERETHRSPESQPKEQRLAYCGQRIGQVPAQWNRLGARTHPTLPPDHRAGGSAMSEPPGRKSESGSGSQASKRRGTT